MDGMGEKRVFGAPGGSAERPAVFFTDAAEFRAWLQENHATAADLWMEMRKVHVSDRGLTWAEAVPEALCFGWIDSLTQPIDDDRRRQRWSPRRSGSTWSKVNVAHVERLIAEGRMAPAGLAAYEARSPGRTGTYSHENGEAELEPEVQAIIDASSATVAFLAAATPGYLRQVRHWIDTAKQHKTRISRAEKLVADKDAAASPRAQHPPFATIGATVAEQSRLDKVIALARHRGFVFQAGEIYGGSRSAWDYGPLGTELKENIRRQWWQTFVRGRGDMVGLDSSIILPKRVWEASGHVATFTDPLVECLSCHKRFRADNLIEDFEARKGRKAENGLADIPCPNCGTKGQYTEPKAFSGLVKTYLGVVDDESGLHFLRPETAQGIFVNFANVLTASRKKPPFGIGQVGKAFRNEITPGNFIFRTREFEQMEIEFFTPPAEAQEWFEHWVEACWNWFIDLGIDPENMRQFDVPEDERAHYSAGTIDFEYRFGFQGTEWGELMGVANRTDYDLSSHSEASGTSLSYFDQASGERYTPYVIEPSFGLTRAMMAFLVDAYVEEEVPNAKGGTDVRTVLRLDPRLAPVKVAVLPLSRNENLSPLAREVADTLRGSWAIDFDDAGAIGRRYRRQDEIGTPFCVTVDFDSLDDRAVTVRDRDTMAQERVSIDELHAYLAERLKGA
ncbi:hypothetical protein HA402_008540 [Bradysia odoriphaga]|nr:hypothetical protein HA402_008540 [Bradysia odoriphaga]